MSKYLDKMEAISEELEECKKFEGYGHAMYIYTVAYDALQELAIANGEMAKPADMTIDDAIEIQKLLRELHTLELMRKYPDAHFSAEDRALTNE